MEKIKVRPYRAGKDEVMIYAIWRRTLGHLWPLSLDTFRKVTTGGPKYMEGDHMVAAAGNSTVGFLATVAELDTSDNSAGITLVLVDPLYQRQGIGRRLVETAHGYLCGLGAESVIIGGGVGNYFWPGVPADLPYAAPFFEHLGWEFKDTVYDMICHLFSYRAEAAARKAGPSGLKVRPAEKGDLQRVAGFAEAAAGGPARTRIKQMLARRDSQDILIADDGGEIVGLAALFLLRTGEYEQAATWRSLLGEDLGAFSCLTAGDKKRREEIERILVAYGSHVLQEKGVKLALAAGVSDPAKYQELGYEMWREYQIGRRKA